MKTRGRAGPSVRPTEVTASGSVVVGGAHLYPLTDFHSCPHSFHSRDWKRRRGQKGRGNCFGKGGGLRQVWRSKQNFWGALILGFIWAKWEQLVMMSPHHRHLPPSVLLSCGGGGLHQPWAHRCQWFHLVSWPPVEGRGLLQSCPSVGSTAPLAVSEPRIPLQRSPKPHSHQHVTA